MPEMLGETQAPETASPAASAPTAPAASPTPVTTPAKTESTRENPSSVADLETRLEIVEAKLKELSLRTEMYQAQSAPQTPAPFPVKAEVVAVIPHPSEAAGEPVELTSRIPNSVGSQAASDSAIRAYRQAMIFYNAAKFSESILAFSSFLERYADHPLAGAAQFYIGESYFNQKEYKLAATEYQRVLTSYDRSSHIALALRQLAKAEDELKMTDEAAKHRHLLLSLFPHSPFIETESAPKEESVTAPIPEPEAIHVSKSEDSKDG